MDIAQKFGPIRVNYIRRYTQLSSSWVSTRSRLFSWLPCTFRLQKASLNPLNARVRCRLALGKTHLRQRGDQEMDLEMIHYQWKPG